MLQGYEFAVLIILIIIIIAIYLNQNSEYFDTYRNHDIGAYEVYQTSDPEDKITINQAALKAKYDWSDRDPLGQTVYDIMYDNTIANTAWNGDSEYAYRDIAEGVYSSKFSLLDGSNYFATYKEKDMYDSNPVQAVFGGETITLSQKQY